MRNKKFIYIYYYLVKYRRKHLKSKTNQIIEKTYTLLDIYIYIYGIIPVIKEIKV